MNNTNKKEAAGSQQKSFYLNRIIALTNRIQRNHLRCIQENGEITKRLKSIEKDIDLIAQEVARQAEGENGLSPETK